MTCFLKNYKYCVSEAISKKLLFFGSSQLAWQQQHRLNQWCEFKAGLSTNRRVFGNSVWKQSLFSWVVHKLHTLALTFLFWSSNCFSNNITYGKNWTRKIDGSPILWFQTFIESASHLEYLRNVAGIKTLSTTENKTGITLNTDDAIILIKPLFHH